MEENQNRVVVDQTPQATGSVQPVTETPFQQPVPNTSQSPVEPQPLSEPEALRAGGQPFSPQPPKSSNKILLIGLIFLIFAVIVGGGYLYLQNQRQKADTSNLTPTPIQELPSPTPDPTAGWETYTNTKYG